MLDEIALKYGTDKSSQCHNYTEKYEFFLGKRRLESLKLLEIGVLEGASLKMWGEYLPQAKLYGVDINPSCQTLTNDRTEIFIGDQNNLEFLKEIISQTGELDIIIDDGSHIPEHQINSFETLFPHLKSGGLYVIEDLHTGYMRNYQGSSGLNINRYLKNLFDTVNFHGINADRWITGGKKNHHDSFKAKYELSYLEKYIKGLHFYKSICFIEKDFPWLI